MVSNKIRLIHTYIYIFKLVHLYFASEDYAQAIALCQNYLQAFPSLESNMNKSTDKLLLSRFGLVQNLLAKIFHATSEFLLATNHYEVSLRVLSHADYFNNSAFGFSFYQSILRSLGVLFFHLHVFDTQYNSVYLECAKNYKKRLVESWHVILQQVRRRRKKEKSKKKINYETIRP